MGVEIATDEETTTINEDEETEEDIDTEIELTRVNEER